MKKIEAKYLQHKQEITVTVTDTDFTGQIKPSALMGYFQDVAMAHAEILGLGYKDMIKRNAVWVMIRMSFKILKCPQIGETLTIITVPEKPKAVNVNRGYYVYNQAGEPVIVASSKWCVLDAQTHKPQRCVPFFEKFDDDVFIPYEPLEDGNCKIGALEAHGSVSKEPFTFAVQVTDLDQNMHMNNTRYGDITLNAYGTEMLKKNRITRIDVNFLSQLFIGDLYEVFKVQKENSTLIEAKKAGSDTVIFRGNVLWERRKKS